MPKQSPQHAARQDDSAEILTDTDVDLECLADAELEGLPSLFEVALSFASRLPVALRDHQGAHDRCFIQARKFMASAIKAKTGQLWQEIEVDPLFDCLDDSYCPNLPDDHPFNLTSKEKGSIDGLKRVLRMAESPKSCPEKYQGLIVGYGERLRARIPDKLLEQLLAS